VIRRRVRHHHSPLDGHPQPARPGPLSAPFAWRSGQAAQPPAGKTCIPAPPRPSCSDLHPALICRQCMILKGMLLMPVSLPDENVRPKDRKSHHQCLETARFMDSIHPFERMGQSPRRGSHRQAPDAGLYPSPESRRPLHSITCTPAPPSAGITLVPVVSAGVHLHPCLLAFRHRVVVLLQLGSLCDVPHVITPRRATCDVRDDFMS